MKGKGREGKGWASHNIWTKGFLSTDIDQTKFRTLGGLVCVYFFSACRNHAPFCLNSNLMHAPASPAQKGTHTHNACTRAVSEFKRKGVIITKVRCSLVLLGVGLTQCIFILIGLRFAVTGGTAHDPKPSPSPFPAPPPHTYSRPNDSNPLPPLNRPPSPPSRPPPQARSRLPNNFLFARRCA